MDYMASSNMFYISSGNECTGKISHVLIVVEEKNPFQYVILININFIAKKLALSFLSLFVKLVACMMPLHYLVCRVWFDAKLHLYMCSNISIIMPI